MHGIQFTEISTGVGAVQTVSTSIVGVVATAPAGDNVALPLNTPILVTDLDAAIDKAGAGGTLRTTLTAIRTQSSPVLVIVRVAEGADAEATEANVVAGVELLAKAPQLLGVTPKIIGAPGLDGPGVRGALAIAAGRSRLDGMAYTASQGANLADRITDRNTVGAREIMLIAGDYKFGLATHLATAIALGLRAKIDQEEGPHRALSNVAVQGATGLVEPFSFDLVDPTTDVGMLNENDVTATVMFQGFRFWGVRTASDDSNFAFEPAVRVGQLIRTRIARAVAIYLAKPMHPGLARDLMEFINGELAQMKAAGLILGGTAWLDAQLNNANGLKTGKLVIDFDYTVPPPLEMLGIRQRITDRYLTDFVSQATD